MANGTWKIARGRNSGQWPLVVFAVLALLVLLLGRVQPVLFNRARAYLSDRAAPVLEVARTPVDLVSRWVNGAGEFFTTYKDNVRLRAENARLRQWQIAALVLEQRLKRYQQLLHAVPDPAITGVTARVIGRDSRPFLNTLILDAGRRQGVKPGEAVVDPQGMIGRILVVGDHTSWVILLTDLNSRIPVSVEPGNVRAMLAGDNTASPTLEVAAQRVQLKQGQPIVTSGDGGLLPGGLPVGMVWWDGQVFRAALLGDAMNSDDVRILDLKLAPEPLPALTEKDLPVAAAGLPPLAPKAASAPASPTQPGQPGAASLPDTPRATGSAPSRAADTSTPVVPRSRPAARSRPASSTAAATTTDTQDNSADEPDR